MPALQRSSRRPMQVPIAAGKRRCFGRIREKKQAPRSPYGEPPPPFLRCAEPSRSLCSLPDGDGTPDFHAGATIAAAAFRPSPSPTTEPDRFEARRLRDLDQRVRTGLRALVADVVSGP